MTGQNGRAFNEWLKAQLKAKKMSQRQLAQQSGVDHSTISRLIRGDRMPSLGTATKLARGLREIRDDSEAPQYLGAVAGGTANPTARVEYALRADEVLSEPQVRHSAVATRACAPKPGRWSRAVCWTTAATRR
jgi:transcriptional regulator with XRE-family HTH domain